MCPLVYCLEWSRAVFGTSFLRKFERNFGKLLCGVFVLDSTRLFSWQHYQWIGSCSGTPGVEGAPDTTLGQSHVVLLHLFYAFFIDGTFGNVLVCVYAQEIWIVDCSVSTSRSGPGYERCCSGGLQNNLDNLWFVVIYRHAQHRGGSVFCFHLNVAATAGIEFVTLGSAVKQTPKPSRLVHTKTGSWLLFVFIATYRLWASQWIAGD